MGEPSIAYLMYRILDDLKGRIAGFDDSLRTPVASFHSPGARAIRALPPRSPVAASFCYRVAPISYDKL